MEFDVKRVVDTPGIAIHIPDEDAANDFVRCLKDQYPEYTKNWNYDARWKNQKENWCCSLYYHNAHHISRLIYGPVRDFKASGLEIHEYYEFLIDDSELPESEEQLDLLFV